jgi:CRISPR type III-B/RAMP module RAMP protein Cmr6
MTNQLYNLPHETVEILGEYDPDTKCQNMGLLLDKYMPGDVFKSGKKGEWLSRILNAGINSSNQNNHFDPQFARQVYERWKAMLRSFNVTSFELAIDWRMVVGLGGETVLETDLTLHHLYGIPVIPGSALKGLTRAYAASEKKQFFVPSKASEEERRASEKVEDDHPDLKSIFGEQDKAGTVIFFDAMPVHGKAQYEVDVMNPHYPDYYRSLESKKITPPANDQSPNPVMFLTVAHTTFAFAIAPRDPHNEKHRADATEARTWLREALQKYGVGGKTSAGYGYFNAGQEYTRPENLKQFQRGEDIRGIVLDEKSDKVVARYIQSGQASKCLQYQMFPTEQVIILIPATFAEETSKWKTRNTSICRFLEERVEDNRTLLICEPKKKG